ncbi:MAG: FtsX-like permease family protein [Acidobacteriota bacterium]
MSWFKLVRANLRRRSLRSVLTVLCIAVAFILFSLLGALEQALSAGVDLEGVDRLVVRHKVSIIQLLPASYGSRMEKIEGVRAATPNIWFGGVYQDPKNFFPKIAVEPSGFLDMYPEIDLSAEHRAAWESTRIGAIVGADLLKRFSWSVGDRIPVQGDIFRKVDNPEETWEFEIVGVYRAKNKNLDESSMYFRIDYLDQAMGELGQVGWYLVSVNQPEQAAEIALAVDSEFANSPNETKTSTEKAFAQGFANQIGNISSIIRSILTAVFFTILLVAANTMAQAVRERTAELAVLKSLGFSDRTTLFTVLGESMLLALAGGLLGLGIGYVMVLGVGEAVRNFFPIFHLPADKIVTGVILVLGVGLVAGLLPALQANRLRIADALRRV